MIESHRDVVREEWIDENAHMNVGYYGVVFDYATDGFFQQVGLGREAKDLAGTSTFAVEARFTYQCEVVAAEALRFTTQLLAFDAKRIHYFHRMWRERDGTLSATNELVSLHVSQATRRSTPMAPDILERLAALESAQRALPRPAEIAGVMGLR